ncbi:MAG: NAD(P)/FAD-dependent oxidoreductase [Halovenus sp.]
MDGSERPEVLVVGGAVAGLAAADPLADPATVTLYERESYDEKRVNCGEAINDTTLVPLELTPENGFVNDIDGFQLEIYPGTDRPPGSEPLAACRLACPPGYICDRNVVERQWARRLEARGVEIRDGEALSIAEYRELIGEYDYIVDATGQPSMTLRAFDLEHQYSGDMVALNAEVEGDFGGYQHYPRIFFEGYVGYAWSFPKSESRANIGIGWAGDQRPENYFSAFEATCRRAELPVPDRSGTRIYTIPKGPSLAPEYLSFADEGIFLVGDAAGIANRYQGEGICQAIRSSYLLAELVQEGREAEYPALLHSRMRSEYRLAHLMRGAWIEHEDPELLAAVARALDGLTIDEITSNPQVVYRRLIRRPRVAARLVANRGMLRRFFDAYTDSWEYTTTAG